MADAWLNLDCFSEREAVKVKGQAFNSCLLTLREQTYLWHPLGEQEWLLQPQSNLSVPGPLLTTPAL